MPSASAVSRSKTKAITRLERLQARRRGRAGRVVSCPVPSAGTRARPALAALWVAGIVAAVILLQRSTPLLVNLGAGDEPFVHGFRSGWEREGRRGNPETMFRWTEDGARLILPVAVAGRSLRARIRLARFTAEPAEITILAGGREVDRWTEVSRGFHVREVALGAPGPLALQFRSASADGSPLGVALDWVEFHDAGALRPPPAIVLRALALLIGVPVLAGLALASVETALGLGAFFAWSAAAGAWLDRLGTLLALAGALVPVLLAGAALLAALFLLRRCWPEQVSGRAVAVPLAAAALWLALVSHPFYFYPDVETHVRMAAALEANPSLLADPTQPWARRGDVTRDFGGRKVAIPYAFVFHALAWPLAPWLGAAAALKTVAIAALGVTLLLVFPLARVAGLGVPAAVLAQVLAAAIPVSTSRVTLALYPTLLGQAAVVLLLVHLARRLRQLEGARDAAAATAFLFLAQVVYTGSILGVAALVAALALLEALAGERRRSRWLLGSWAVATALVLLQYVGFLPVLWQDVLPHLGQGAAAGTAATTSPLVLGAARLGVFFDAVFPLLVIAGLLALRAADPHVRRVLGAAIAAGCALAVLRFVFPAVLRDAKEVELLVAPVAVCAAAAIAHAWARGGAPRALAAGAALAAIGWGTYRSALWYADRFWTAGR